MKLTVLIENTSRCDTICHEHGLSLYLEVNGRKLLFDAGQTAQFTANAANLGVNLAAVDTAILSHGHYDHGGGLTAFLAANDHAPLYAHRDVFQPHYHGQARYIGLDPALKHSDRFRFTGDHTDLGDGLTLTTCNGRSPAYPIDSAGLTAQNADGSFVPEDFRHEQYLLVEEAGKRILISGCSHKGILNLVDWFRPDILIGGFHFMEIDPDTEEGGARLDQAAQVLLTYPTQYWTCHCTGKRPYAYLKERMGGRLNRLSAGDQLEI